jgi:hypothetical protein
MPFYAPLGHNSEYLPEREMFRSKLAENMAFYEELTAYFITEMPPGVLKRTYQVSRRSGVQEILL